MARSDQTPWVVEVLEGPAAGAVIELDGRKLPYGAGLGGGQISFGKVQRTKLDWYPGSRVASQQVIGPTVEPTTIDGRWKERYIGEDQPIDLVELFEELLEQGCQLRVSWQTKTWYGIVKRFRWFPGDPIGGVGDVRWEMTFEWNRADIPTILPRVGNAPPSLRDFLVTAASAISDLGQLVEDFVSATTFFVGEARAGFGASARSFSDVVDALDLPLSIQTEVAARGADFAELPSRMVESASTAAASAISSSSELAELSSSVFHAGASESDEVDDVLTGALDRYEIVDQSFTALEAQDELRVLLEDIVRPDEFATVAAIPGSDLRTIAVRYYGDADAWPRIAKLNGLSGSLVPDDLDVIVVPLALSDATDDRVGY